MEYVAHSHRHGLTLFNAEEPFATLWTEVITALESISDEEIVERFEASSRVSESLSAIINTLLKERLVGMG